MGILQGNKGDISPIKSQSIRGNICILKLGMN